ncbi:Cox26p ASCRUDRAFT_6017 [Ascoidea rubescens DSM 1968]|uniref:Uncharacterized protein n=1 Tax=Ascoidea rubescens DSM 1968 TaxID=1344418 RepID=A0A1D2VRE2_9ASCO|nr:hypothetical protein ASCRUDRAFT_6017 [Ascoidea rubescens DSM 1968]ODV64148.1 hypothetical protein ASCRUDRAFT_6017 [Ascoidea rubescens DSM 1968]
MKSSIILRQATNAAKLHKSGFNPYWIKSEFKRVGNNFIGWGVGITTYNFKMIPSMIARQAAKEAATKGFSKKIGPSFWSTEFKRQVPLVLGWSVGISACLFWPALPWTFFHWTNNND